MSEEIKYVQPEQVEARKNKTLDFFKKAWIFILFPVLILVNIWIRTLNVKNLKDITTGGYTLGPDLDPFLFLRYSKYIIENGSLMAKDMMRYVPLGYNTAEESKLLPYMMAYVYKILHFFSNKVTIEYSAVMFPVVMSVLIVIAFFLFARKVFENKKYATLIAFIATAFLVVSPPLLSRTIAGIPEKESVGFLFFFLIFYFFISAFKSDKLYKKLIFSALAGLSTVAMGLIWGGIIYIFTIFAIMIFVAFFLGKIQKNEFYIYTVWFFTSIILLVFLTKKYTLGALLSSTSSGFATIVFFILLIDYIIFNTKLKNLNLIQRLSNKLSERVLSIGISIILIIILSSIIFGINFIPSFINDLASHLTQPYVDRLSLTVAENKQPYFSEWKNNFGPLIQGYPLFFWLFFLGSILFFYEMFKLKIKEKLILTGAYVFFLCGLIFSRFSPTSTFNGTNFISKFLYFFSILLFFIILFYIYYKYRKDGNLHLFKEVDFSYLLVFSFFIISLIGARSAVRLIMVLPPVAGLIVSYFLIELITQIFESKTTQRKIIAIGISIIIFLMVSYTFYTYYQTTKYTAINFVPSIYTQQWQKAMAWVRDNTPINAVFAHWWDYGYWVQSIGNRATVLDGGNAISYWDHLLGRHVLCGHSEIEALEFLYTHNATYLLIDSSDIGKYPAFSSIGADENYDRYSWIPDFILDPQRVQETRNSTVYPYFGAFTLDQDYLYYVNNKQVLLPAHRAGIGIVTVAFDKEEKPIQSQAVFVYNQIQYVINLRHVYYNQKLYDFNDSNSSYYEGTFYIYPEIVSSGGGVNIANRGAGLFISEEVSKTNLARLYLFNEAQNFTLVENQPNFFVESLRNQGLNLTGDFLYYNGFQGPIKIWQINYPSGIQLNPEYLSKDYPAALRISKEF